MQYGQNHAEFARQQKERGKRLNYMIADGITMEVQKEHTRFGLSPGEITRRHAILKDVQSRKRKAISETHAAKKRRRQLRVERSQTISSTEIREGVSYESGVDMKMNIQESIDLSITPIPPPVLKPESVSLDTFENLTFFDVEATGLERDSHITQIAATRGSEEMSCYILPKKKINYKVSQVTGITTKEGRMFHFGKPVPSLSINEAINKFMQFCTITAGKVVLVGHNSKVYDCPILLNAIKNCSSTAHFENLDTRKLFQLTYPGRKSYSQESLFQSLCNQLYQAHDAHQDASSLKQLFESCNFDDVSLKESSFSLTSALDALAYSNTVATNFPSLEKLVLEKVLRECMARKIAGSGLNLKHLHIAYLRNGTDGICSLFIEGERRVRVTKSKTS